MIEIDPETRKIFFYYTPEEIKANSQRDENMIELELLTGHVCPDCKSVLEAYYIGTLPIKTQSECSYCHPYLPSKYSSYSILDPHYKYGQEYGGGYLKLHNHNQTICQTFISDKLGLVEGIKAFVDPEAEGKITDDEAKEFADKVLSNSIPGVYAIKDVCEKRPSILAINRKVFSKNISYKDYTDQRKEYDFGLLFRGLVKGDPDVIITLFSEIST